MKARTVALIVIVAVIVGVAATFAWWFRYRPFAVFAFQTRRALSAAGLSAPRSRALPVRRSSSAAAAARYWSCCTARRPGRQLVARRAGPAQGPRPGHPRPRRPRRQRAGRGTDLDADAARRRRRGDPEASGGRPVTLVGNSLGGWLAMLVAHRHPEWSSGSSSSTAGNQGNERRGAAAGGPRRAGS